MKNTSLAMVHKFPEERERESESERARVRKVETMRKGTLKTPKRTFGKEITHSYTFPLTISILSTLSSSPSTRMTTHRSPNSSIRLYANPHTLSGTAT
jgi:hypothetical protein